MDNEGKFPKEMERTTSLHYNVFDLDAFFLIASMADKIGMNVWTATTPSGKSLKKGFDYFHPYLAKEKEWTGEQIKPFEFEEGYSLLLRASEKYACTDCRDQVTKIAGDKEKNLLENLVY
jgi:hypothetical protein